MKTILTLIISIAAIACQGVSAQSFKWLGHPHGAAPFNGTFWESQALGVSGEGTVVGDFREFNGPFDEPQPDTAWSWKDGTFTTLPFTRANYITPNGRVILGENDLRDEEGGFISTESVKWELIEEDDAEVTPSVDGSVVKLNEEISAIQRANGKWEEEGTFTNFRVNAVSADSNTFVGVKYPGLPEDSTAKAAVWTNTTETILPLIPGTEDFFKVDMFALAVSGDGSVVVGYINIFYSENSANNAYFAFIWTRAGGTKTIIEAAVNSGIEWDFDSWDPEQATAISTDGRFIAGWGDLDGENIEPWVLELGPRVDIVVNSVADRPRAENAAGSETGEFLENGDPECTLRSAIETINAGLGDTITFNIEGEIGTPIIVLESELPPITSSVVIDGSSQNRLSLTPPVSIRFTGSTGLNIEGGNSRINGLNIGSADPPIVSDFNSRSLSHGITLQSSGGNEVDFCYIGTSVDGMKGQTIQGAGIYINNTSDNTISNCLLSGNWWAGVAISGTLASENLIVNNKIGTNVHGNASLFTSIDVNSTGTDSAPQASLENNLGNGLPSVDFVEVLSYLDYWWIDLMGGIVIENASFNTITGNKIGGNNWSGITLSGTSALNNVIQGNDIGYDPDSESPSLRNIPGGNIRIVNAPNNLIGGELAGEGNAIQGLGTTNTEFSGQVQASGVVITGSSSVDNKVQGNRFRDLIDGVSIGSESSNNIVFGNNLFLDCVAAGVTIQGFENTVAGNSFGGAEDVRQARWGVIVDGDNNLIGGDSAEFGNRFTNTQFGSILCGLGTGNTFRYNVHKGSRSGIELWGTSSKNLYGDIKLRGLRDPDRNDKRDSDTGGNNQQNYPLLNVAQSTNAGTILSGFLDTSQHFLNTPYTLDFYQSGIQIGSGTVVLGPAGLSKFDFQITTSATPGEYLYATATSEDGSTSEFSRSILVDGSLSTDADGLSDEVEDLVPNNEASANSTTSAISTLSTNVPVLAEEGFGDGNGDAILDSEQDWVTSFPTYSGDFLTIITDGSGTNLVDVSPYGPDWIAFSNIIVPLGMVDFGIANFSGDATVIDILLPANSTITDIWYFGKTPGDSDAHWFEFSYDGTTGAEIFEDRIRLHFVDGQRGDTDLQANGAIQASVFPVQIETVGTDIGFVISPSPDPAKAKITWASGLPNLRLEKSFNLSDWTEVIYESQTIDGKETLLEPVEPYSTFYRIITNTTGP
ncbi:right-handed parallel beta-helix repeat-containing protein [Pelagicoccus sp. SDUM812002]|uniref:right-handed parallel beta-helix repeat-containing protein n=1 Tax=Pelagicoccus sp. SDUM812002 TaxID=3041266 RepID=UPI00280FB8F2|nr:right-handed parallel beta-helix repeat-containing protein [Pelagicoccus sp. SDUM812002]MDQ8185813.1 right-handed parallel beta-helix repeat-containing protein [Pelagicoccus sp. SDUM812002]